MCDVGSWRNRHKRCVTHTLFDLSTERFPVKTCLTIDTNLDDTVFSELINRIDEVVVFHALGQEQIQAIASIQLDRLRSRLAERDLKLGTGGIREAEFRVDLSSTELRRLLTGVG